MEHLETINSDGLIKQNNRIKELDALRGIAALSVMLFHFTIKKQELLFNFNFGVTGVDLFFIISGFVIYMSLSKVKNSLEFVINRVSRLYPTYWVSVLFTSTIIIVSNHTINQEINVITINRVLANLTMFQLYLQQLLLDASYWSMLVEMLFYVGILILFSSNLLKYLNIIAPTLIVISVVLANFYLENYYVTKMFLYLPILLYFPLFFAGTLFFQIYKLGKTNLRAIMLLFFCLIAQLLLYNYSISVKQFISLTQYGILLTFYFATFYLFVNGKLKFIVNPITLFIGKISFAFYLIHQLFSIEFVIPLLTQKLNINYWVAAFGFAMPLTILVATLITNYIEIPFGKLTKNSLRKLFSL